MTNLPIPSAEELYFAYMREKSARKQSEKVLQTKTRELYNTNEELIKTNIVLHQHQRAIIQQEKLAALGTLTAGMAHEINNPLSFVMSNVQMLKDFTEVLIDVIKRVEESNLVDRHSLLAIYKQCTQAYPSLSLSDLMNDIQNLTDDSELGLKRVKQIILSLKNFSRNDDNSRIKQNINESIQSAVTILSNEIKNKCQLTLDLSPVDLMFYSPNSMIQVIINIITNAMQAFVENQEGEILIKSHQTADKIYVSIRDNGCGMSEETISNIFLPFFTTKPLGVGTGLGLSICYEKIKDMGGVIEVESTLGVGTCFTLIFSIDQRSEDRIAL